MKTFLSKSLFTLCLFGCFNSAFAQLTTSTTPSPTFLVQNILLGPGVTASGITFTGDAGARGSFGGTHNVGFPTGVILATGDISNAIGPNNNTGLFTANGLPGDPDLDMIMSTTTSFDATVLEFDFVAQSDSIKFNYVFASEEYMEYVDTSGFSTINDAFGFFISGPGISGPFSGGAINIALVPGTSLPVTMQNLNLYVNSAYYVDNGDGEGGAPPGATVQYDGMTVPLTALAEVQCGATYHIKLAVADGGDDILDSGVFLEEGSFTSPLIDIHPITNYSIVGANDSTFYEGCGEVCLHFVRSANLSMAETLTLSVSGTATPGVDYPALPSSLTFAVGQDSIVVCIDAVNDFATAGTEGLESIILSISQTIGACGPIISSQTLYLTEFEPFVVAMPNDTTLCNLGGTLTLNSTPSGGVPPYTFSWSNGSTLEDPTVSVATTTTFILTANDACLGSTTDPTPQVVNSVTVTVQTFAPMVLSSEDVITCPGDQTGLSVDVSGGGSPYVYSWTIVAGTDTLIYPNSATPSVSAISGGTYQVEVTDVCGNTETDLVNVFVEQSCALNIPNIVTPDGTGPLVNEFFYIENLEKFPGSTLKIYNRWGNKIYESADYKNNWNGGAHGEGTYYYVLTVPMAGTIQAKANQSSLASKSFKETANDTNRVFAGFFQLSTLK